MSRKTARTGPRPELLPLEDRATPATLSGTVFADGNANGNQDASEVGIGNVTVQLDANADGLIDQTATTDSNGFYSFASVNDGTHTVIVVPPGGTSPIGSTTRSVTITGGADVGGVIVGLQANGTVSGTVFADLDSNGRQDPSEPGLAGIPVGIDIGSNGVVEFTTSTDSAGHYEFNGIVDGLSRVSVSAPLNHQPSTSNPQVAVVSVGGATKEVNFGMRPTTAIAGKVYLGSVSTDSPGVAGLIVQLDAFSNGTPDYTTTTASDGSYYFATVPNGTHTIKVVPPDHGSVATAGGTDQLVVTVNSSVATNQNFAVAYPGSATGSLYMDLNKNGKQDDNERDIPPGKIQVYVNGSDKAIDAKLVRNSDGSFTVTGLPDGDHVLSVGTAGGYAIDGNTRIPFTVANGSGTILDPIAIKTVASSTLTLGNGSGADAQAYTFQAGANGTLTPVAGKSAANPNAAGGTRVVSADFNGDGVDDLITATGAGERAMVHVFDGVTGMEIVTGGIPVFESSFTGGLYLSAGDFNLDGKADIVVSADVGGGSRVQVLNAAQFQTGADAGRPRILADFLGIDDANFRGGSRTAVGDLNGDGTLDLIVAAGAGGGPRIAIFDGATLGQSATPSRLIGDFFSYENTLRNGATVAVGDVNGDGKADLVTGAGPGGAPRVTVFSGSDVIAGMGAASTRIADFYVNGDTSSRDGTRIAVKDLDKDGKADLVTTSGNQVLAYTATGISNYYINPGDAKTPTAALDATPFGGSSDGLFVG